MSKRYHGLFVSCFTLLFGLNSFGQETIFEKDLLNEINIEIRKKDWDKKLKGLKKNKLKKRITGKITINGVLYDSVGIRYKGNSSYFSSRKYKSGKLPLNIKLDHGIKKQEMPDGNEKVKLSNIFRDPSYVREILAYEIARKYMPAPRANFARVKINEVYNGLFHNTESIEKPFLKRHYGSSKGVLIKCDPNYAAKLYPGCKHAPLADLTYRGKDSLCYYSSYELKTDHGWKELISLTHALQGDGKNLDKKINIDQTLWFLAFNNITVNLDSYIGKLCHNYYLYLDKKGQFQPLVWDMNLSFGGFTRGRKNTMTLVEMQELSPLEYAEDPKVPLIHFLLKNKDLRKIYLAHYRTILEENFANNWYLDRSKEIQNKMSSYILEDRGGLNDNTKFKENLVSTVAVGEVPIVGIEELMKPRIAFLKAHPLLNSDTPTFLNFENLEPYYLGELIEKQDSITTTTNIVNITVTKAERVVLHYRKNAKNHFKKVSLSKSGEQDFMVNLDQKKIKLEDISEFYFSAYNEEAGATLPATGSRNCFERKTSSE